VLTPSHRALAGRALWIASALLVFSAAIVLVAGGYSVRLGPVRLTSHKADRDLIVSVIAAAAALALRGRERADASAARALAAGERRAARIAALLSVLVFGVGMAAGTRCACASDQYGYVSEAHLWAAGGLHVPQPLASAVPWPMPEWTLSPLGYRPATYPAAIVPTYAPGLPMTMAIAEKLSGSRDSVFVVVPLLGALVVWTTFAIGRRLDTALVGLAAALLVACSATFLFQLIQPMSDVPVTAWWLLAVVLLFRGTTASALASGLACSAAVLTRPNLVPLIIVFAIAILWTMTGSFGHRLRRLALFIAGALPGPIAVAFIQRSLYGAALRSGYGTFSDIYAVANVGANLKLYPAWLWDSHGAFIAIGLFSPLVWVFAPYPPGARARSVVVFALAFTAMVCLAYVFYSPFDNWTYTRFLLPAIPLVLLLGVWTLFALARSAGSPAAQLAVLVGICLVACAWAGRAIDRRLLLTKEGDARYKAAGEFVAAMSPMNTLVLAMQHSGTIRYYGNRLTVRYDWLNGDDFDRAIEWMRAQRRGPLIVLEDWEEKPFRERFVDQRWGRLDWPARAELEWNPKVRVYDPADRDRFLARESVKTVHIGPPH